MLGQTPSVFESPRPNPIGFLTKLHVDLPLLTGLILLSAFGLLVLFSASGQDLVQVNKQLWRFALAYGVMLFLAQIPPSRLHRLTPWLYGATLLMLAAVTLFGVIGKGAQRWLDIGFLRFQPSEFAKLTVPLMISWLLSAKPLPPRWPRVMIAGLVFVLPAVLIAEQPDLGTALLVASAGVFALFLAGMSWRLIGLLGFLAAAALPLLWFSMRTYQRQRVFTLLNPEQDPLGTGYHIIQSKIAIGSGGLYGKGWLYGTQSHLDFLPESSTDFIFAVLGEELGLIGILLLLGLYLFVILRGLYIATQAQDSFARLLAGSLTLVFFVYIFVNTGMVSGILPVVGVPLPLISYGGTSLVTIMAGFGILMSIHTHRKLLPT